MTDKPLKVALLGAGGRGRDVLLNWVQQTKSKVSAVIDPSLFGENSVEHAKGVEFTTDIEGWLRHPDADIVTINSWDPQHAENAIQCFNAGLNIQVAKPMTQTTEDADRVVIAWKNRSGRYATSKSLVVEKAKELID
jgi:predicted dehydrogenase